MLNGVVAAPPALVRKLPAVEAYQSRKRSCNTSRSAKLQLFETLSEEFGDMDKFGNVSDAVATQFMEFAAVIASCKHFIKENFKFDSMADFIGIDLDQEIARSNATHHKKKTNGHQRKTAAAATTGTAAQGASSSSSSAATTTAENSIDSNPHRGRTFTGALCWPYITEEIGFDVDLRIDKTLVGYEVKRSTLSKAISRLATRRSYHSMEHFLLPHTTTVDREKYKQQCYFVTHVIYAFSDWGQHPLKRQLFAEEFEFIVTNTAVAIEVLKVVIKSSYYRLILRTSPVTNDTCL